MLSCYVAPGITHIAKLVFIMALVENVHLDQSELAQLYALNRKNLRKTINELQFFIQQGGDDCLGNQPLLGNEPELHLGEDNIPLSMLDSCWTMTLCDNRTRTLPHDNRTVLPRTGNIGPWRNQNEQQLIRLSVFYSNLISLRKC